MNQIKTSNNFKFLARMGYAARGSVYLIIGFLALSAALGMGGQATNSKGAIMNILQMPFGEFMVVLLIIGLVGYVLWRLVQGLKDTDSHGHSAKGLAIRSGLVASGITHLLLAVWATSLLLKDGGSSSGGQSPMDKFLQSYAGAWSFGVIGLIFIGVGIAHMFKGATAKFEKYMNIPADKEKWAKPLCQFGLIARGVVWCVLGWIIVKSAMSLGGQTENKGTTDALQVIADNAYGNWLLGAVACGLLAFGIYSVLESMYRRINVSPNW